MIFYSYLRIDIWVTGGGSDGAKVISVETEVRNNITSVYYVCMCLRHAIIEIALYGFSCANEKHRWNWKSNFLFVVPRYRIEHVTRIRVSHVRHCRCMFSFAHMTLSSLQCIAKWKLWSNVKGEWLIIHTPIAIPWHSLFYVNVVLHSRKVQTGN